LRNPGEVRLGRVKEVPPFIICIRSRVGHPDNGGSLSWGWEKANLAWRKVVLVSKEGRPAPG
jgi:hypothetical protein